MKTNTFMPGYRSIIANASFLGIAQLITNLARIVYAIGLARFLDAELYGRYNYGLSWYLLFLPISALGLNWVLSTEIGKNPSSSKRLVSHTKAIRATSAVAVFSVSILLALLYESDSQVQLLLVIFSFALLGRSLSVWLQSVFVAKESAKYVLQLTVIFRLAEVVVGIALLLFGYGLIALATLHSAVWLAESVFSYTVLRRIIGSTRHDIRISEIKRILRKGLPFLAASIFMSWLLQGPMLLFRHEEGLGKELGYLGLALQAFTVLAMMSSQLGNAALPVLSRSVGRNDGKSDLFIQEVLRLGWFIGGVFVMGAMSLGPAVIEFFVGIQYLPVASILPWSLSMVVFYFWSSSLQGLVGVHGRYDWVVIANFLGSCVFTIGFAALVPMMGMSGVVLSMGAGLGVTAFTHLGVLRRYHRIDWIGKFLKPGIAVTAGVAACWYATGRGNWLGLVFGLAVAVGVAFISGAVTRREMRFLLGFLNQRGITK